MREKTKKAVFTFATTAQAIAMEKSCKQHALSGRLIPVPRQISAGCGLAWSVPFEEKEQVILFIQEQSLAIEKVYDCLL